MLVISPIGTSVTPSPAALAAVLLCALPAGLKLPSFPHHQVSVKYATEHRCGVVIRGPGLTDAISGTDPLKDNLPLLEAQPEDGSAEVGLVPAVLLLQLRWFVAVLLHVQGLTASLLIYYVVHLGMLAGCVPGCKPFVLPSRGCLACALQHCLLGCYVHCGMLQIQLSKHFLLLLWHPAGSAYCSSSQ